MGGEGAAEVVRVLDDVQVWGLGLAPHAMPKMGQLVIDVPASLELSLPLGRLRKHTHARSPRVLTGIFVFVRGFGFRLRCRPSSGTSPLQRPS
jgi:hypothetical protein